MLFESTFSEMVSLGADCRVRYQLSLARWRRAQPPRRFWQRRLPIDLVAFEADLYSHGRITAPDGSYPFDWLVTHGLSLVDVLEADFAGFFERRDLGVEAMTGRVRNFRTRIDFPHAFSHPRGYVDEWSIDREYADQRRKFDHLVAKFRALRGRPVLYVVCGNQSPEFVARLRAAIGNPAGHVLSVRMVPNPQGLVHDADGMSIFEIPVDTAKPAHLHWQGDDAHWGAVLDRLRTGIEPGIKRRTAALSLRDVA